MKSLRVLVVGGGDVGSAVAHRLFGQGVQVLIAERPKSPHARRGMAFTDAMFDGRAVLDGVEARLQSNLSEVEACWTAANAIPIVTLPESLLMETMRFDAVVEATLRRYRIPPDLRAQAELVMGLGPGYVPGINCHIAIETQWGPSMGKVLCDQAAAERSGGPRALEGVTRERFVLAPNAGTWQTTASLGQPVQAGDVLGHLGEQVIRAPIAGHLRGLARVGVEVLAQQCLLEVDPRQSPQIFGLGERPLAIACGVAEALAVFARNTSSDVQSKLETAYGFGKLP
jgi:xanthine dehydrogenase accessory factor